MRPKKKSHFTVTIYADLLHKSHHKVLINEIFVQNWLVKIKYYHQTTQSINSNMSYRLFDPKMREFVP